ncbi:MAG: nitrite/sulfite reductase [Rhodospirillaceae bacterium]|nr:nitrite/sulfite reductase [Rhodospirillaceae bacterium]
MYRYDEFDHTVVRERVVQFREQVGRRLAGEITEDEFKPLRLMNGLYLQLHAYMLRVAIPYGTLSSRQMRTLAHIARAYDKGYGHFTTRQNIQYNWPKLVDVPDLLDELAKVEMHALQTSGNCIRNVTADPYAGVAAGEVEDPRIYAEIIRQWSTLHPEFAFLPRKFKIALTGTDTDRAAVKLHDIGIAIIRDENGAVGFRIDVGGGQGRTPIIAETIRDFLPKQDLLPYLEAILRVYNMLGRRDNIYKARIKILVQSEGLERFTELVEEEFTHLKGGAVELPQAELDRIRAYFAAPRYETLDNGSKELESARQADEEFAAWVKTNVDTHKQPGYAIVNISLKPVGGIPGDASAEEMEAVADLADRYSFGEIRVTHEQNLTLPSVQQSELFSLWLGLKIHGLATANIGHAGDIIACPGLDYCNLANARSIPVAQAISRKFENIRRQHDIGRLTINISGCINACGHHHVGNIGLLGVEKNGEEFYQITLGGRADENAEIGRIVGPAFSYDDVPGAVETVVETYLQQREDNDESFVDAYARLGATPFKEALYATR